MTPLPVTLTALPSVLATVALGPVLLAAVFGGVLLICRRAVAPVEDLPASIGELDQPPPERARSGAPLSTWDPDLPGDLGPARQPNLANAFAALLAAGLHGVEKNLKLTAAPITGTNQGAENIQRAPRSLKETTAIFRIAARCGYPDGFTMSNQMKRLTGFRPTEVRQRLGWEWVMEAWLRREGLGGP